jgi:hypothetical protein
MGEIKVTVSSNKPKSVSIKSQQVANEISASADTGRIWAQTSKNWAVSDLLVENTDYSSKYYANQAKESASSAEAFNSSVSNTYNIFIDTAREANEQLETTTQESLASITKRFDEGIGDGLNQITGVVDESIAEYTQIANQIKQDNSESSKLAKDWATSEVLVDNIDYSAKYYAEKAKDNSGIFYDELTDEDIDVEILDLNYATKSELELGLDTKQDKGNYALKSEIPSIAHLATKAELPTQVSELENDSNYATQTQVLQAIASIPQFSLSIVNELPTTGEKMTLYLVPKEGTNNDVYDEYIWIEQTASYEHLGTTAVDLTDYVKNTDYATTSKAGIIIPHNFYGCSVNSTGYLIASNKVLSDYQKMDVAGFVSKGTLENVKNDLVKRAVTANDIELTDDEKTSARTWLGAVGSTDYATSSNAGIIKASSYYGCGTSSSGGYLLSATVSLDGYKKADKASFIAKGTLDNVLTQYSKTVLTTEADYEALETKDANTLYLIEE